jgi:mRNA interferase RelE/StbE
LGRPEHVRITRAIQELPAGDVKRLVGGTLWRLRIGDWRVIFERDDERRLILVLEVHPRGSAYRP